MTEFSQAAFRLSPMTLADVIVRCVAKWRAEGILIAPPLAEAEVRRTWSGFRKPLSADVLQFYTTVGGFQGDDCDDHFFWFLWPWDRLQKRNTETPREGVMFSDHSIEVVTWELRYEDHYRSSVWSSYGEQTATSLEAFLEQYLKDPWELL